VSRIDLRGRLNVPPPAVLPRPHTHDSLRYAPLQSERAADGENMLTLLNRVRVAENQMRQFRHRGILDLQQRQIEESVHRRDLHLFKRLLFQSAGPLAVHDHTELLLSRDHMLVGDHMAALIDDKTRTET